MSTPTGATSAYPRVGDLVAYAGMSDLDLWAARTALYRQLEHCDDHGDTEGMRAVNAHLDTVAEELESRGYIADYGHYLAARDLGGDFG